VAAAAPVRPLVPAEQIDVPADFDALIARRMLVAVARRRRTMPKGGQITVRIEVDARGLVHRLRIGSEEEA
jgi:hypothetical protein